MNETEDRRPPDVLARWVPALLVLGLILFHGINNWIWLSKNLIPRGWDRIGALINSLYYHDTLSTFSLQALFRAATQDEIRPPLFGLSMALMYKPFGVSSDVAVMANVVYLAILLGASYGIGAKLGGRRLGMLAALLVALTPLLFAMSRYSYFEFSVAALTTLSIYFLLASERFTKRGSSVLLGLSLGLGLLAKRTFPVFVVGALGVVILQAGLLRVLWARLRMRPHFRWRDLGLALGGGLLLSALWYFPNRDLAQALPAGFWMFPLWWLLAAITIYILLRPSDVLTNFLSCGALAVSLASLWYLPHSDFVQRALRAGWGVDDPRGRSIDLANLATYTDYLGSILHGLSPFYILLLLLSLGLLLIHFIRRRRRLVPTPWWDWDWWVVIVSLGVSYIIMSTSIYKEPRAITPALPFLAIILAGALLALPWRRLRRALIVLAILFGLVQFFAISYTETRALVEKTNFGRPVLGVKGIFAQGPYLDVPDSGLNDPGFYIAGDVLQRVDSTRQIEGWETISLGILAGSSHVNAGMFAYDQIVGYPSLQLENPVLTHPDESGYSLVFRYDYMLVLGESNKGPAVRETVDLILNERRPQFEQAFELEKVYPLPDDSQAYLFRRRFRSAGPYDASSVHDAAKYLALEANGEDLILVHPPGLINGLLEHYWGPAPVAALSDSEAIIEELGSALEQHPRLFLVTDRESDSEIGGPSGVEAVLVEDRAFGELRVVVFEATMP